MAAEKSKRIDEAQIRELLDRWLRALRAKDLEGLMSCYLPDIFVFDLLPPLRYAGADAYRKNWAEWFPTFQGPIGYELRDLTVANGDDVAFSHSLNRRGLTEQTAIPGCGRPFATERLTASG